MMQRKWQAAALSESYVRDFSLRLKLLRWMGRQTWLPKGQDRLLRLICNPDRCSPFQFEVDFFGQRYRGNLIHYIDWMVFCYGSSARPELTLLEEVVRHLRRTGTGKITFVDVGANAGHHTLFMAPLVDHVVAFEPFAPLRALIEDKIRLNNLRNVTVVPFALGDREEERDYFPGEGANSGIGTFLPDEKERAASPTRLAIKRGDQVLKELGVTRVDILKIDVEGFEPRVLRGLENHLRTDRPVTLMELSEEARRGFGSEQALRGSFYDGARFAGVGGREGCRFRLVPFDFEKSEEVVVLAGQMERLLGG